MSSMEGSFGAQPWSARIAGRWGHHGAQLLIGSIIAVIAMRVHPPPADSPVTLLLPLALIVVVLTSWMLMRRHDRGLCEHCLAAMPLDASAAAARFQWRLQVCHLGSNKPVVFGYLGVLIGSNFLPGMAGMIIWIAVQTSMIYLVL